MQELALASDSQLRNIAHYKSMDDFSKSPNRRAECSLAAALPIMDSFLVGAATQGTLKQKVLSGGNQLKDWGIFLVVTGLYRKAINSIVSKSETLQNFRENSPFIYGVTDTALAVTAGISGVHYANLAYKKFISPLISKSVKNSVKKFVNSTDNSTFGRTINEGMKTFAKKYPNITGALNVAARWALPLLCLGVMGALAIDMIKAKVNEKNTYKELADARLAAAQQLVSNQTGDVESSEQ